MNSRASRMAITAALLAAAFDHAPSAVIPRARDVAPSLRRKIDEQRIARAAAKRERRSGKRLRDARTARAGS
jgi:hypothetical protein